MISQDDFDAIADRLWPMWSHLQDDPAYDRRHYGHLSPLAYRREPTAVDDPATLVSDEDVRAWIARDPFVREATPRRVAACLAYLWVTFGGK